MRRMKETARSSDPLPWTIIDSTIVIMSSSLLVLTDLLPFPSFASFSPRLVRHLELDNYYGGDVPAVRPESPSLLSQADTSQPHRFSAYSDTPSRPVSTATLSAPFLPNRSSDLSSKDLPLPPGLMGYSVRSGLAHQNVPSEAYWPVSDGGRFAPQPAKRGRKRWLLIGGIVLGAIALIGIIAGVLVSRKKGGPSSSSSSNANTRTSNLGNPSDFAKDPKLHQSFYGFAYTPNVGRSSVRAH